MIHVCFAQYDKTGQYSKFTGTAITSIFENTAEDVTVHLLHDNTLTQDNRDKFIYIAGRYNQRIKFYNVEELCADYMEKIIRLFPNAATTRYTIATYYRFFIPSLLASDIKKAIYLDSDVITNLDIAELWRYELEDKPLAAVNEISIVSDTINNRRDKYLLKTKLINYEDYFNAGVLIINLEYWRDNEDYILEGLEFTSAHLEMIFNDQDTLNYLFSKNYVKLPEKFDVFIDRAREYNEPVRAAMYHFIGSTLGMNVEEPFNQLWFEYFAKTPWFDLFTLSNSLYKNVDELFESFGKINRDKLIKLSAAMAGKTRAFVFKSDANINRLTKTYLIRDDEEIYIYDNEEDLPVLIDEMTGSRDKKIFFVRVESLITPLTENGFVEGKDFFDHYALFSTKAISQQKLRTLLSLHSKINSGK